MDEVNTPNRFRFFDLDREKRGGRQDYRAKLQRSALSVTKAPADVDVAGPVQHYIERVYELARATGRDTTVFQAVVVAALQTLTRIQERQQQAAAAAISLAQGEKMQDMVDATDEMIRALTGILSTQGSKMLRLCTEPKAQKGDPSWWFALTETLHAIEDGMERMTALVYGQPKGAPSRTLSSLVIRMLHHQHNALLAEAEQWIS